MHVALVGRLGIQRVRAEASFGSFRRYGGHRDMPDPHAAVLFGHMRQPEAPFLCGLAHLNDLLDEDLATLVQRIDIRMVAVAGVGQLLHQMIIIIAGSEAECRQGDSFCPVSLDVDCALTEGYDFFRLLADFSRDSLSNIPGCFEPIFGWKASDRF